MQFTEEVLSPLAGLCRRHAAPIVNKNPVYNVIKRTRQRREDARAKPDLRRYALRNGFNFSFGKINGTFPQKTGVKLCKICLLQ